MDRILDEARALRDRGVKELILIAQDTTDYGHDLGLKPRPQGAEQPVRAEHGPDEEGEDRDPQDETQEPAARRRTMQLSTRHPCRGIPVDLR